MKFEQAVRVPAERIGAIIGKDGQTKKGLEEKMGVQLLVDSREGLVVVRSDSVEKGDPLTALRVVEAIGRGFSPQRALKLLEEGAALEVIDLREYAGKSANSIERIRGRIIGLKGKSRRVMEELTQCHISVYGRTVAIIGDESEVRLAAEAVRTLASGSQHKTVYNTLQRARTKRKMERLLLWEDSSPEDSATKFREIER
ncbi:MAG TPA: KH domain-containing protein [Nitrososphaerales archaeon]|nr:KH domain-containing protein [Nitrososphaerales archaeon]